MSWKCAECGHQDDDYPKGICSNCGLVQMGQGTHEKYEILEKYCFALSLIMRNKEIEHYLIDACAGSGIVQAYKGNNIRDGSPLIMAKIRQRVQERIKDKNKEPSIKCKFIECDKRTVMLF
jgi:three-Cys-motif partner protein